MGYTLTSEATNQSLSLSSGEWKILRDLASSPAGWTPREGRDYTARGRIDSEEALEIAESVEGMLGEASSEQTYQQHEQSPETIQELRESLGYEEEPLTFFGDPRRRYKAERFVRLASAGAFEIVPDSEL